MSQQEENHDEVQPSANPTEEIRNIQTDSNRDVNQEENHDEVQPSANPTEEIRNIQTDSNRDVNQRRQIPLPIEARKRIILETVRQNQVVIITGNTGCGKSTKLPQMLYHENYARHGIIACTQPRRIAAWSLAKRVASEMETELGSLVGYKIRHEDVWDDDTKILYLTDGSLLGDIQGDLQYYSVVIIDEVHQRSVTTDVLLGLLKTKLSVHKGLKLILSSATVDSRMLSQYFNGAPVVHIEGSPYHVEIIRNPTRSRGHATKIVEILTELERKKERGDVLVFLPGKKQIFDVRRHILRHGLRLFLVLAHSEMSSKELRLIYKCPPEGQRKVILATNIAESSLTIETIAYVIDSGLVNVIFHDGAKGTNRLQTLQCSRSESIQRKGRCGRTRNGICYQLYDAKVLKESPVPQVRRVELSSMIVVLKANGYHDVRTFDFLESPNEINLKSGHDNLHRLEVLDDNCRLTSLGRMVLRLPLEPNLAVALIRSAELGCSDEMLRICSCISAVTGYNVRKLSPLIKGINGATEVKNYGFMEKFIDLNGETMALGRVLSEYMQDSKKRKSIRMWCEDHQFNEYLLYDAYLDYDELCERLESLEIPVWFQFEEISVWDYSREQRLQRSIAMALLEGFFYNLTKKLDNNRSTLLRDDPITNNENIKIQYNLLRPFNFGEYFIGCDLMEMQGVVNLVCLTSVPDDIDLSYYRERCRHRCSHLNVQDIEAGEKRRTRKGRKQKPRLKNGSDRRQ